MVWGIFVSVMLINCCMFYKYMVSYNGVEILHFTYRRYYETFHYYAKRYVRSSIYGLR
ncbi:hypothetical protein SIPHO041v1_p0092 [Vibrio phage 234P1]|nr:hypothetical protein SIPHO036v1_90010 [Vibrio phage 70E38.1]QZI88003.1 hypothetical protein SIPHO041v1_p0092 [Vibrio phage 234P1]QZI88175.1 hypothetical protein SIPHO035v1_p0084 [Vibrio phage 234P7B]QZI88727.1 hypothetical protein SIPHO039v1_p0098 [Vibrio phage 70E35.5a]QZI88910.1 hypothetical protein SIPHO040v1_p0097 [Vibrio phage 70E35.6]QZI89110.1 hypothetical protein SIPHO042v1_p0113 [Vibrio phage 70E37.1]